MGWGQQLQLGSEKAEQGAFSISALRSPTPVHPRRPAAPALAEAAGWEGAAEAPGGWVCARARWCGRAGGRRARVRLCATNAGSRWYGRAGGLRCQRLRLRREWGFAVSDVSSVKILPLSQDETKVRGAVSAGLFWKMSICCDPMGDCVSGVEITAGQGWLQHRPEREEFHLWKADSFYTGSQSKAFPFSLSLSLFPQYITALKLEGYFFPFFLY